MAAAPLRVEVRPHGIPVEIRRMRRARRMTLRIRPGSEGAVLTVPSTCPEREIRAFLHSQEAWLLDRLSAQPCVIRPEPGEHLPILGKQILLGQAPGRRILEQGDRLLVPGAGAAFRTRLAAWLRHRARDVLTARCDLHAEALGREFSRIVLRDTRSRWGSCSSGGALMFSWRLVLAPFEILDYVAAHEVAHLCEMNHGPQFWALVARLDPDYRAHRTWLRDNGAELHRYKF